MKKLFLILPGFALFLCSCKKNIPASAPWTTYSDASFSQVFEGFWTGMNTNYVWWSDDSVNWDAKYTFYKPLFASLNIHDSADQRKSLTYFSGMTAGLIDSHYYISFSDSLLSDTTINPAKIRKMGKIDSAISTSYFYNRVYNLLDTATRVRN